MKKKGNKNGSKISSKTAREKSKVNRWDNLGNLSRLSYIIVAVTIGILIIISLIVLLKQEKPSEALSGAARFQTPASAPTPSSATAGSQPSKDFSSTTTQHLHSLTDLKQGNCLPGQYVSHDGKNFVCSSLPSVPSTSSGKTIYVNILDYGAIPNDDKDDWAAIQKALDGLKQGTLTANYVIFMPAGTYRISDTLQPPNSAGYYTLMGEGKLATQIRWFGPKGKPMIKLLNARGTVLRDFALFGNGGAIPSYGILVHVDSTKVGAGAPTGTYFENLLIANFFGEVFEVGIGFTSAPDYDYNNEGGNFINVNIEGAKKYGYSFEHSNSLNHNIYGGLVNAGEAAINNINPAPAGFPWGTMGGSFAVFGTLMNVNEGGYIFRLGAAHHSIMVVGASVEGGRLLTTPVPITQMPTTIQFIGGTYKLGGGGNIPNIYFDASSAGSILSFNDVTLAGVGDWIFPSSGSKVIVRGGVNSVVNLKYNNEVSIDQSYNSPSSITFSPVNLGKGRLTITDSSGGFDGLGTFERQRFKDGDKTPSVQGWDYFEAHYTQPTEITDFKDGYVGKEFTLFVSNGNLVIKNGAIRTKNLQDLSVPADTFIKFRKVTAAFGSFWKIESIE